jgi:hypothetical protein
MIYFNSISNFLLNKMVSGKIAFLMNKETEGEFFSALVVNENFRKGVLDPATRLNTIEKGFAGKNFELTEEDKIVLELIGPVQNLGDFAEKFIEISGQVTDDFSKYKE